MGRRAVGALLAYAGAGVKLRRLIIFVHDVLAAGIAWIAAFWLRFNFELPPDYEELMLGTLPWVLSIHAAVFWMLRLYRGLWRYASLSDLQRIAVAIGIAALAVPAAFALLQLALPVPRTVYVLTPVLLGLAMGGNRLA
jgi:FlaA1/EpsC-like NDP-sugar epimerase